MPKVLKRKVVRKARPTRRRKNNNVNVAYLQTPEERKQEALLREAKLSIAGMPKNMTLRDSLIARSSFGNGSSIMGIQGPQTSLDSLKFDAQNKIAKVQDDSRAKEKIMKLRHDAEKAELIRQNKEQERLLQERRHKANYEVLQQQHEFMRKEAEGNTQSATNEKMVHTLKIQKEGLEHQKRMLKQDIEQLEQKGFTDKYAEEVERLSNEIDMMRQHITFLSQQTTSKQKTDQVWSTELGKVLNELDQINRATESLHNKENETSFYINRNIQPQILSLKNQLVRLHKQIEVFDRDIAMYKAQDERLQKALLDKSNAEMELSEKRAEMRYWVDKGTNDVIEGNLSVKQRLWMANMNKAAIEARRMEIQHTIDQEKKEMKALYDTELANTDAIIKNDSLNATGLTLATQLVSPDFKERRKEAAKNKSEVKMQNDDADHAIHLKEAQIADVRKREFENNQKILEINQKRYNLQQLQSKISSAEYQKQLKNINSEAARLAEEQVTIKNAISRLFDKKTRTHRRHMQNDISEEDLNSKKALNAELVKKSEAQNTELQTAIDKRATLMTDAQKEQQLGEQLKKQDEAQIQLMQQQSANKANAPEKESNVKHINKLSSSIAQTKNIEKETAQAKELNEVQTTLQKKQIERRIQSEVNKHGDVENGTVEEQITEAKALVDKLDTDYSQSEALNTRYHTMMSSNQRLNNILNYDQHTFNAQSVNYRSDLLNAIQAILDRDGDQVLAFDSKYSSNLVETGNVYWEVQ